MILKGLKPKKMKEQIEEFLNSNVIEHITIKKDEFGNLDVYYQDKKVYTANFCNCWENCYSIDIEDSIMHEFKTEQEVIEFAANHLKSEIEYMYHFINRIIK